MPSVGEVAALGIASAGVGEDPLSSIKSSRESRSIPAQHDELSTSGPLTQKLSHFPEGTFELRNNILPGRNSHQLQL